MNLPRTTLLVGRKGTGKSTIFQKSQKDLATDKCCISIYIDVKSLYDNSTPTIPKELSNHEAQEIRKYFIYTHLLKIIILETKMQLNEFVNDSIYNKILGFDFFNTKKIYDVLDSIENSITDVIKHIDSSIITSYKQTQEQTSNDEIKVGVEVSKGIKTSANYAKLNNGVLKKEFENKLVTYLDIKSCLIDNLLKIKEALNLNHLYIFLDDYSEISLEAQELFMNWFIGPLNNLSSDFVKFKIATYPHRFYYGMLDNSKIDEISLDFFDAYYTFEKTANISRMELLALDYTNRLITKRFELFFPNTSWDIFFELSKDELVDLLFSTSLNNPRKMGYILSYCYESCLIHNTKISREAVENATLRYYNDVTLKYFTANKFLNKPFNDKISNEHHYELLLKIIERQKLNISKSYRTSIKGKPGNHFLIGLNLNQLINNLELNGFISTYNCTKDKNNELTTIYTLDFGLCKRYNIGFQRANTDSLNKYFNLPRFNLNILVVDYFNKTQIIKCPNGHDFSYKMLDVLKQYQMKCPTCIGDGIITKCELATSNEDIKNRLKQIENKNLTKTSLEEFILLDYLKAIIKPVTISKIADTLDRSDRSTKLYIEKLLERDLVKEDIEISIALKKQHYTISDKGAKFLQRLNEEIDKMINS